MKNPAPSAQKKSVFSSARRYFAAILCLLFTALMAPAAHAASSTSISLAISATSVPYKSPIILTATVTSGGSPVTSGLVLFCDATATFCETNSALSVVQVTSPNGKAVVKLGSGPLGVHSYKAVYRANSAFTSSTSNTVSYSVAGTYASTTSLASAGSPGSYTLAATVTGVGSLFTGPTGNVTFIDTSAGNNVLGTQPLGIASLNTTFTQAPNSPFTIGNASTPERSVAIASAYLDGDNNLDIVTGDANQIITVLLGNGDGTFKPKVNYPGCPTGKAFKILLADFNRDGNTDVLLGCSTGATGGVTIILGNGDGTFQTPAFYSSGDVAGMAIGDFNNDGLLDIAVTDHSQRDVTIFLGNGDGTFHAGTAIIITPTQPKDIVVGDFNGDGLDDLAYSITTAVAGSSLSDLYVAFGKGDGTFKTPVLAASTVGEFLASGDLNADNTPDIVATTITGSSHIGNSLFVLIGKGDGTFKNAVTYVSDIPSDPHITDVNGDGKPDIIAGGSYGALVYLGNGDGTFQPYTEPVIGGFALTYAVNAGDYNNDGNADLVGTDANNPRAAVSLSEVRQSADAAALTGLAVFPLGSGTHYVEASYPGNSIYTSSVSATVPLLAAPTPTTTTLAVTPSSATLGGQAVTLTATLSPYTVGPPTTTTNGESINFYSGATLVGTGVLNNGVATLTTTNLPIGSDALKAVYPGDPNYLTSSSSVINVTVAALLLSSSLNPSTYTQSVTFTATVATGETGTVTFKDGTTTLGTSPISGGKATFTTSTLTGGSHDITGVYSGDGTHNPGTSPILTQIVNKATTPITVTTSGASTFGNPVTITGTVQPGTTGTITFTSGGTTLGTGTVNSSGVASITISTLPAGSDPITGVYSGDGNYNSATGTTTQTVTKGSPASTLTSSANPAVPGASVTFTDTLPSNTTGTVTFTNGGTTLGTGTVTNGVATFITSTLPLGSNPITATYGGDSNNNTSVATLTETIAKLNPTLTVTTSGPSTYGAPVTITATLPAGTTGTVTFTSGGSTLGSGPVTAGGTVTITTSALPVGTDTITASYGGDATNNSATGTVNQIVGKGTPTVTVTTSGPSTYGSSVTITATVPTTATGTITITSGGQTLGSGTVSAAGTVTVSTSTLPVGADTITASYGGDANNNPNTGTTTQTVSKATPTSTLTSSLNPAQSGVSVTFTDTLPTGVTGTVTFNNGATVIGTSPVTNGVATVSTSSLPIGSDTITATYSGDNNNSTSTATLVQVISKITPTISVTTSGPSVFGTPVTITTTLTSGTTGSVTITSGGVTLGTGTVNPAGIATVTTTALPVGTDTITATYGGDATYTSATATTSQTVSKASPSMTLTSSVNPSVAEQPVTFTATLPTNVTGQVTFTNGATTIGTGTVTNGVATVTTSTLPLGADVITATYGGDSNNASATATLTQTVNKGTPTVTVTTSGPATYGQTVTVTASVPAGSTGTITFTSGGNTLGSGTVSPTGTVTITTTTLPVGTDTITASYGGDTNNFPATGSTTEIISKGNPTVTVTTSGPSTVGDPVTITTTLPPGSTGTVTVTSGGTTIGNGTVSPGGTVTVTTSTLPVGSDPITVTYSGDSNNNPGTASTVQIVSKVVPSISLVSSVNPSNIGQAVTFTATLPSSVTGTVTFSDGGSSLGTVTVASGVASVTTSTLTGGSHTITATYNGDTNNGAGTSAPLTQVVNKNTPVLPPPSVSSTNPTSGTPVTITETVPPGVTGPVTFSNGGTVIGTAPIVGGTATITVPNLPVGSDPITASTPGDTNNNPATSPATVVTVTKATPTITITSSANPSSTGQSVTFTATAPSNATGIITFLDGATVLGTGTLTNGQATLTNSTLTVGTHPITASFPGDANNNAGTSAPLNQVVNKGTPNLPPPTVSSSTITAGGSETITETVPPGVTGPVTFSNGGTVIGTAPIVGGTATITITNLPVGTDPITASTPGDANNNPATSPATPVTVVKGTPVLVPPIVNPSSPIAGAPVTITEPVPPGVSGPVTFTDGSTVLGTAPIVDGSATITVPSLPIGANPITASTPGDANNNPATSPATTVNVAKTTGTVTLTSSANPAQASVAVTFTATVAAGATGAVTFRDGTAILGTGTLNAAGIATFTTSTLAIGSHPITAAYAGDTSYSTATSAVLNQVIGKIPTAITISTSSPSQLLHNGVTFTAVVTAPSPTPTGTVTFYDGTTVIGTAALSTNGGVAVSLSQTGNAVFATTGLATGAHHITAVYSGDDTFASSTSAPADNMVEDFTNVNSGPASQNIFPGATTSYKFTLTPISATTFLNDVKVDVDGLPPGSTFTFTPATIAAGGGAATVTLNVTTSKSLSAYNHMPHDPSSPSGLPIALGMVGLAGLGAVRKLRKKMPRTLLLLLLSIGTLLPIAALTGCAGGYFTLTPTTYTVTVTGTEGSIQHTATATLVVQ
jgi:hypothetical protein